MAFALLNRRGTRRRASIPLIPGFMLLLVVLSILLFMYNFVWSSGSYQAKEAANQFYEFEKVGNYGSSWELFHSQMKTSFPKEKYIQQRAMVMMQQLGAQTFSYEISGTDHLDAWSMGEGAPALEDVYRMHVTMRFLSVFGELALEQEIYAAKEDGNWKLLWSFHDPLKS